MIHQFPHAHPDELLLSLCVRYHKYAGYCSTQDTMAHLFGKPNRFPTPDLPGHLSNLASELPPPRNRPEWLMTEYTLLPLYLPFQPLRSQEGMKQAMTTGNASSVYKYIGMTRYYRLQPEKLRFCPRCCEEDTKKYTQAYWHRLHQVPGVLVCQTHRLLLQQSDFPNREGVRSRFFSINRPPFPKRTPTRLDPNNHVHRQLLRIAESAAWLLWTFRGSISMGILQRTYWDALEEQGFIAGGRLNHEELQQRMVQHYSPEIMSELGCGLEPVSKKGWVVQLLNPNGFGKHPLEHILMMNFLDIPLESVAIS